MIQLNFTDLNDYSFWASHFMSGIFPIVIRKRPLYLLMDHHEKNSLLFSMAGGSYCLYGAPSFSRQILGKSGGA